MSLSLFSMRHLQALYMYTQTLHCVAFYCIVTLLASIAVSVNQQSNVCPFDCLSHLFLARSAKLPTGLYILLALISSFFNLCKAISGSTGPIFTIFLPNKRYLRELSRSRPLFYSFRGVAMPIDFWQKFCYILCNFGEDRSI